MFNLIKKVLRSNPLSQGSTEIRKLAVKVILKLTINSANESPKVLVSNYYLGWPSFQFANIL